MPFEAVCFERLHNVLLQNRLREIPPSWRKARSLHARISDTDQTCCFACASAIIRTHRQLSAQAFFHKIGLRVAEDWHEAHAIPSALFVVSDGAGTSAANRQAIALLRVACKAIEGPIEVT